MPTETTGKGAIASPDHRQTASINTIRIGTGYDVYVNGVRRTHVPLREPSNSIVTAVTRDGSHAAMISDHDTNRGTKLVLLDVASGSLRTLVDGPVTSAAFSADGTRLAYALAEKNTATVWIGSPSSAGRTIATVAGRKVEILGFGVDKQTVFVVAYPDRHDDGAFAASLLRLDAMNGTATSVLTSDLGARTVYADFRLATINGRQVVSFIRTSLGLFTGPSALGLVDGDGTIERIFGVTSGLYREASWSEDGRQVAFTFQSCVSEEDVRTNRLAAVQRQSEETGTFVADLTNGRRTRVVEDISSFRLAGFDRGVLRFSSDWLGVRTIDGAAIERGAAPAIKAGDDLHQHNGVEAADVSIQARTNRAVHINQVYDTRDEFDGRGSCGPTTAVMTIASYQLGEWGLWVNEGGQHWSPYGRYITDKYIFNGTTYSATWPDYSGRGAWAGAHGYMVGNRGTEWYWFLKYLNNHTGWAQQHAWDPNWIRGEINRGQLVAVSGQMTPVGHFALIKGYTDDGRWVVNDPFGPNTTGRPGGADQIYTTTKLAAVQVWSN